MSFNINLTALMKMGRNYTLSKVILQLTQNQFPKKRTQGLTHHGVRIVVKLRVGLYFRLTGVLLSDQGASLDRN